MYALTSTNFGFALLMSSAYSSVLIMFLPLTEVIRIAVLLLKLFISSSVLFKLLQPSFIWGLHNSLYTFSLGASKETYSWVGSLSRFPSFSQYIPLLTRNVVKSCLWNSAISSSISGYNVGSPASEIAAFVGFLDSSSFFLSTFLFPPNPHNRLFCAFMAPSMIVLGSSYSPSHSVLVWLRSLQQKEHFWLQNGTAGDIWRHLCDLTP